MPTAIDQSAMLDKLYGATLAPEGWLSVLQALSDTLGGTSAWLSRLNTYDGTGSGLATRLDPEFEQRYHAYYHNLNPYGHVADPDEYLRNWRPTVLTDAHRFPRETLVKSEYYNDFMRPQDAHSVLFIRLVADDPYVSVININRSLARGVFTPQDRDQALGLQSHLIRAFEITRKLSEAHAERGSFLEAMHRLPTALFALSDGRIYFANHAAETLLRTHPSLRVVGGRLSTNDPTVTHRLAAQIDMAGVNASALRRGGTVTIPPINGSAPLTVNINPLRLEDASVFTGGASVLVSIDAGPAQTLASLLSRRERDCMRLIAQGNSDLEISVIMGVSHTTVISHVQNAKRKLGAKSRAQAIARCYEQDLL